MIWSLHQYWVLLLLMFGWAHTFKQTGEFYKVVGSSVTIPCKLNDGERTEHFYFIHNKRNGQKIQLNPSESDTQAANLTISDLTAHDDGYYECIAKKDDTSAIFVDTWRLKVETIIKSHLCKRFESTSSMICEFEKTTASHDIIVKYTTKLPCNSENEEENFDVCPYFDQLRCTWNGSISNFKPQQFNSICLLITANNSVLGKVSRRILVPGGLQLVQTAPVSDLKVVKVNNTTVKLNWLRPETSSDYPVTYKIILNGEETNETIRSSSEPEESYFLTNLDPTLNGYNLTVMVKPVGSIFWSETSDMVYVPKGKPDDPRLPGSYTSPVPIGNIVGPSVAAAVVLAVIIIIVISGVRRIYKKVYGAHDQIILPAPIEPHPVTDFTGSQEMQEDESVPLTQDTHLDQHSNLDQKRKSKDSGAFSSIPSEMSGEEEQRLLNEKPEDVYVPVPLNDPCEHMEEQFKLMEKKQLDEQTKTIIYPDHSQDYCRFSSLPPSAGAISSIDKTNENIRIQRQETVKPCSADEYVSDAFLTQTPPSTEKENIRVQKQETNTPCPADGYVDPETFLTQTPPST